MTSVLLTVWIEKKVLIKALTDCYVYTGFTIP